MKAIRWALAYLWFRAEAIWYAFPTPHHYACYSADLVTRRRLKS